MCFFSSCALELSQTQTCCHQGKHTVHTVCGHSATALYNIIFPLEDVQCVVQVCLVTIPRRAAWKLNEKRHLLIKAWPTISSFQSVNARHGGHLPNADPRHLVRPKAVTFSHTYNPRAQRSSSSRALQAPVLQPPPAPTCPHPYSFKRGAAWEKDSRD